MLRMIAPIAAEADVREAHVKVVQQPCRRHNRGGKRTGEATVS
jgi:hypothetical protein